MATANSADMQLSVGFDLSSLPKSIKTLEATLKNQKLIANIAYQFGTSQGAVRSQIKSFMASLQKDINASPLEIPIEGPAKDNLPRIRYALYDVASVTGRASQELAKFGAAAVSAAADFESAFTNVERTTFSNEELLGSLRTQLEGLSRDIPLAFKDITEIASLGAQLGIATGDLTGFARTVAEFSAVTNVSTDQAAQSFGALGELLNIGANEYQNLGSAIAQVGVNSVATESEILSVSTQIAGVASSAGLSAEYVVGLSGALASLRVPAEQSRGALTRVFQEINRAAAEGGPAIQEFANVLGVSTEEAQRLAQTDVQTFFSKFIGGLSSLDNTSLTTTLDNLNLSELRVTNTLTRLSRNTELLAQTQGDASTAFEDGTFLAAAYALRVEDLAAKLTILQNSVSELVATFGESILPVVGPIVDGISAIIQGLTTALSTESGKWTAGIALGATFIVSALLGVITTIALLTASLFALRTALDGLGWSVASKGVRGFTASLFASNVSAGALTATIRGTDKAIVGMSRGVAAASLAMRALPIVAIASALVALAISFNEAANSAEVAFQKMGGDTTGLSDALKADSDAYNKLDASAKAAAAGGIAQVQYAGTNIGNRYGEAAQKVSNTARVLGNEIPEAAYGASSAIEYNTRILGANTQAWFANMLQQNESFQNLVGNEDFANFVEKTGYKVTEAFRLQAELGGEAARDYYYQIAKDALIAGDITLQEIAAADSILAAQLAADNQNLANTPANGAAQWVANAALFAMQAIDNYWSLFGEYGNFLKDILLNLFNIDVRNAGKQLANLNKGAVAQASIMEILTDNTEKQTDAYEGLGNGAGAAAEKIYLLTDYANDLSSIWKRAFDIRWSGGQTLDKITSAFSKIAEATANARQEIQELSADIQSLEADQALQRYFLTVAEAYGDTLKAQEIRANLAKIDSDLIKKNKDLAKAQDKTNKTLVGNSDAAIENRAEILDLVSSYQDHIKALAASGMKQDELRATTAQLKADFIAQATQLGYNVDELGYYAVAFDDVKAAIDAVPRDLTVDFNGDPALTAIEEFAAKAKNALNSVSNNGVKVNADTSDLDRAAEKALILNQAGRIRSQSARPGDWADQESSRLYEKAKNLASGGYVSGPGSSTSDSIPANLSNGEYVVKAAAVKQYGVGFFDQLNQMKSPQYFSGGGSGASSVGMVSLSPEDRALLRNVGGSGNIVLYADSKELARSVNDGNRQIVASGGRP